MEEWAQAELQVPKALLRVGSYGRDTLLLWVNPESQSWGPSSFCDALCLTWNYAHIKEMPQATCSNLGIFDGEKYLPEPDCVECVKDLIRFLRYKPAGKVMRLKAQTQDVVTSHFWITWKHWYKYCTQERRWKSLRTSGSWVTWRSQERPCSYPQVFFDV